MHWKMTLKQPCMRITPRSTGEQTPQTDKIYKWSETWQLHFHPDKCKVLSLGNRSQDDKPKLHLYVREENGSLKESPLEETASEKDIGVIIDNKLSFKEQIDTKTTKTNTIMGIVRRTFDYMDKNSFMQLYRLHRSNTASTREIWIRIWTTCLFLDANIASCRMPSVM